MRPRAHLLGMIAVGAVLALPAIAIAGDAASTRNLVLDFERSGALKDLLGKTLGVAKSFLFLSAFVAYTLEAFGRSPSAERDYAAVTWRLVVVLFLLWNYQAVFGGVIGVIDRLEREVAPESTWKALVVRATEMRAALEALASHGEPPSTAPAQGATITPSSSPPSRLASWVYEALVSVVQLLAEGIVFVINWLSRILTATLFILGPLALVASIPRASATGTRWFLRFVTIASWPIFSGVLLSVLVTIGAQGARRQSYLECLVAALVLLVTALATPTLASHVIGGALENLTAAGFYSALSIHRHVTKPAWSVVASSSGRSGSGGDDGGSGSSAPTGGSRGAGGPIANGPWGGGGRPGGGARGPRRGPPSAGFGSGGPSSSRGGGGQGFVAANPPGPPTAVPRRSGEGTDPAPPKKPRDHEGSR